MPLLGVGGAGQQAVNEPECVIGFVPLHRQHRV
jgi:hypothetical protein